MKKNVLLSETATKQDILDLKNSTKQDLKDLERKTDEKAQNYHDSLMTKMDQIIGELEQIRENNEFFKYDINKLKEKVDNHEERIKILETN